MIKQSFKKITAFLLVFALLPIVCLLTSAADDNTVNGTWGDLTWILNKETGKLAISGRGKMNALSPEDAWLPYKDAIQTVVIETGVMNIEKNAFISCQNLTGITISNTVTSIGASAFSGCGSLRSITVPHSVKSIGERAFENCTALTSIILSNNMTSIASHTFTGCVALTDVVIPHNVMSIGDYAFYACRSLKTLTLPSALKSIGMFSFSACDLLMSITLPGSIKSIGNSALYRCSSLQKIIFCGTDTAWEKVAKGNEWDGDTAEYSLVYHPAHTWNNGVFQPLETSLTEGLNLYTCLECGITRTELIEKPQKTPSENTSNPPEANDNTNTASGAPSQPSKGCKSSLPGIHAVIALVAVFGFVFVARKKENE